jgi:sulfide:quinone oxidoreductase
MRATPRCSVGVLVQSPNRKQTLLQVLIAGAGVAGLEAAMALRELAGERVAIEILSPNTRFTYKPMLVAVPFGSAQATTRELAPILHQAEARHRRGALAQVEPGERLAITDAGERVAYDALLIALGGRPVVAVPGAMTFAAEGPEGEFAGLLEALGRSGTRRIAFVVPPDASWSIAAYELALLTAAERDARRISGLEITVVTHEAAPLELFGPEAASLTEAKLEEQGVLLRTSARAVRFTDGRLALAEGDALEFERVVALPRLEVPRLRGLPQDEEGFLPTNELMRVDGVEAVWAAGDAAGFAIKQGGLAAQQADVAAAGIAAMAGAAVEVTPFRPVLRAALITGGASEFMQAPAGAPQAGVASDGPTEWSLRAKLAATHLGPYLTAPKGSEDGSAPGELALRTLLVAADADAAVGDLEAALARLALVERFNLVVPTEYVVRRDEWRRRLDPELNPDAVADRIASRFATAAAALSDLQRRIGWLRALERQTGGEMSDDLEGLERGMQELQLLSRRTGSLDPDPLD